MTKPISFSEPEFQQFFEYWNELRGDDLVPAKSSFEPQRVSFLLSKLTVLQWTPPDTLVVRLMGTEIVSHHNKERTGTNLLDIIQPTQRAVVAACTAASFKQISVAELVTRRHFASGAQVGARNGFFPFRGEDGMVNLAIGVHCGDTDANRGILPTDPLSHIEVLDYRFTDVGNGVPDLEFKSAG